MKETSCEYWFVVYRKSKVGKLHVMKVRGIKLKVMSHMRKCGYGVSMAFSFDTLYQTQQMTENQFIKRFKNYAKGYYDFVMKIDPWGKYPKYEMMEVPINEVQQ